MTLEQRQMAYLKAMFMGKPAPCSGCGREPRDCGGDWTCDACSTRAYKIRFDGPPRELLRLRIIRPYERYHYPKKPFSRTALEKKRRHGKWAHRRISYRPNAGLAAYYSHHQDRFDTENWECPDGMTWEQRKEWMLMRWNQMHSPMMGSAERTGT